LIAALVKLREAEAREEKAEAALAIRSALYPALLFEAADELEQKATYLYRNGDRSDADAAEEGARTLRKVGQDIADELDAALAGTEASS